MSAADIGRQAQNCLSRVPPLKHSQLVCPLLHSTLAVCFSEWENAFLSDFRLKICPLNVIFEPHGYVDGPKIQQWTLTQIITKRKEVSFTKTVRRKGMRISEKLQPKIHKLRDAWWSQASYPRTRVDHQMERHCHDTTAPLNQLSCSQDCSCIRRRYRRARRLGCLVRSNRCWWRLAGRSQQLEENQTFALLS